MESNELDKLREDMETKRRLYERCETLSESKEAWGEYCKAKAAYEKANVNADCPANEYDEQARAFLERYRLRIYRTLSKPQTCPVWDTVCKDGKHDHGFKWDITITRLDNPMCVFAFPMWDARAYRDAVRYVSDNGGGLRTYPKEIQERYKKGVDGPSDYSVLACISGDHSTPADFEEFCHYYGYDTDSRAVERMHNNCKDFALRMLQFFSAEELESLSEIQ